MKSFFITFRSITYAQRAERVFRREGIRCHLRRTPRWMEERGCGYGVEVRAVDLSTALEHLKREGIPHRRSYAMRADGGVEEVKDDLS